MFILAIVNRRSWTSIVQDSSSLLLYYQVIRRVLQDVTGLFCLNNYRNFNAHLQVTVFVDFKMPVWSYFQLKSCFLLMFPSQRGKIDSLSDGEYVKIDCPPL